MHRSLRNEKKCKGALSARSAPSKIAIVYTVRTGRKKHDGLFRTGIRLAHELPCLIEQSCVFALVDSVEIGVVRPGLEVD